MKHSIYLLFFLFATSNFSSLAQNNYYDMGSNASYTLQPGETLTIMQGAFTGSIISMADDAVIKVEPGAEFRPAFMSNSQGLLKNHGNTIFNNSCIWNNGFSLINDSAAHLEINASQIINGAIYIVNDYHGDILINTPLNLPQGSRLANEGLLRTNAHFTLDANTLLSNEGIIYIYGDYTTQGETFNGGIIKVYGYSTLGQNAMFINKCTFLSQLSISNNSSKFENWGFIHIFDESPQNNNRFINNTELYNNADAVIQMQHFTNLASVIGSGTFIANGDTKNWGSFGYDGGGINFYDASSNQSTLFDDEYISPHISVNRIEIGQFDTNYIASSCNNMSFPTSVSTTLPVILDQFGAIVKDCIPQLEWVTLHESNSAYFEIERKGMKDHGFVKVGRVEAQTNSALTTQYYFSDASALNDKYQYRLKMIDLDGSHSYSRVIHTSVACYSETDILLFPNPTTNRVQISLHAKEPDNYHVSVYNLMGQCLYQQNFDFQTGLAQFNIDVSRWSKGNYLLHIQDSYHKKVFQFAKF